MNTEVYRSKFPISSYNFIITIITLTSNQVVWSELICPLGHNSQPRLSLEKKQLHAGLPTSSV